MNMKIVSDYSLLIVSLTGDIDHHTVSEMRSEIDRELMRNGIKNIMLDFSGVPFMDSSGLGLIMGRYKKVSALGGRIFISGTSSNIKRMLQMSGINKIAVMANQDEFKTEEIFR